MIDLKNFRFIWGLGLVVTGLIVIVPVVLAVVNEEEPPRDDPWAYVTDNPAPTDHTDLIRGEFTTGNEVTAECLRCHEDAAHEVMDTAHWTWESDPVYVESRDMLVSTGKANTINNFCIGIQGNWQGCSACHAGYGWTEATYFETATETNVDCLVCHDQSGQYAKGTAGLPRDGVDLLLAAQSVGSPTRENCGSCHFNGGGGNAVKHGDLDSSLYFPTEDIDVHMGRYDFTCIDCHKTEDHVVGGRSITVSLDDQNQVYCTDCHNTDLHTDQRITDHLDTVACQTCHIPEGAVREPTKMHWDWSQAGDPDREEDPHEYLKIKGEFVYEQGFIPEYYWYSGTADRYLLGDPLDPSGVTSLNTPHGSIDDDTALIFPFKVHRALQPYDIINNYLLQPKTVGEGGYWETFDWDSALAAGSAIIGMDYSGEFGFAETEMYWPTTHMVVPSERALQCTDCHGEGTRFDWLALGYPGDPMLWGGRSR